MAINPLQKYFRQPKIFVKLPTKGAFNAPGTIEGDPENLPVYAMTGMDEILVKTPDALLSGESTVRIIQSCCPSVKNAWDLSNLDVDVMLVAIRIATYGTHMPVTHKCTSCGAETDYDIVLTNMMDHYNSKVFNSKLQIDDLLVKLRPLTYKKLSEFSLKNFELQRKMSQIGTITDAEEQQKIVADLYNELSLLQNEIFIESIDSVEADNRVVTERDFIREWITNAEKHVYDALRKQTDKNKEEWRAPLTDVTCGECGAQDKASIDLDQASFFANA